VTAFLGANTTPANRPVRGVAVGIGVLLLAFEFEYSSTSLDEDAAAPSLKSGMGNVLLQTPLEIGGIQPYVTTGAGLYREKLEGHQQTGLATNLGGGVKVSLVGPLRLRIDYRMFRLGEDALHDTAHRIYAGLNLKF
jgi:hypothetical protein